MRFKCQPVGLDFIDRAAYRFENTVDLEASPEAVFDTFADGESWPRWFDGIKRVVWTSPEPKGVYLDPTLVARLAGPIARAKFRGMFRRAAEGLRTYFHSGRASGA